MIIRTVRKLVFGETWTLPIGVALSVGVAAILRAIVGEHGWWSEGGGFVLLALILASLLAAVGRPRRRSG